MIYQTTIIATLALAALLLVVPKKYFLLPFILAACFIPADQRIIILDLDFTPLRVLILVGFLRIFLRRESVEIRWSNFDKILLSWAICGAVIYTMRWGNLKAFIYRCGVLYDTLGLYLLFRTHIRSLSDIKLPIKVFAACSVLLAVFVGLEWVTGQSPFVILGETVTVVRRGRYRCRASFPHPIILGLFWATLVPLFLGLGMTDKKKLLYWAGAVASVFIVCASASSTPLLTLLVTILLIALFRYRCYGRQVVWALCGLTIALHLVMRAPVWHLISRISIVGGSTGWHRYKLIDQAIEHFGEWALIGAQSTSHWGRGLGDITNQYIAEGVGGGIVPLAIFVYLLVVAVRIPGSYSLQPVPKCEQWLAWSICVSVLGHCVGFLGVAYFGQIRMLLYLTFSIVAAVYQTSSYQQCSVYSQKRNSQCEKKFNQGYQIQ